MSSIFISHENVSRNNCVGGKNTVSAEGRAALADKKSYSQGDTVRSHLVYFLVYLHVILVINSMALSPKRRWDTGEGSHLNYPVTTITQTKALDGRERKIAENIKTPENGLCMYSTAEVGEGVKVGGRERDLKWRVGGMGGGG